jgi:hypothetical protein
LETETDEKMILERRIFMPKVKRYFTYIIKMFGNKEVKGTTPE